MKKIINDPADFVDEVVDGLLLAHPDELRAASADRRALVRTDAGTGGKVGIVTGGGSGHMPFFLGYVGRGLASGVAVGNVFSSPSAEQIHAATVASDDGAGVLYLYGNYGGDVYNFDVAADLAAADGIRTTTVLGTDDILSAPTERAETRRGVAGLIFAYKTAGAAADRGDDLATVTEIAQRTVDRTRTMGVGLSPTILPAAGEPTFTLAEGEMEIGIGIHGEPGSHRGPLETADEITDRFIAELTKELDLTEGSRVALLVNGLGSTPLEELYLIYRRTHQLLAERGVTIHRRYIGEYATSLEMAGASLSVLVLDDELTELIDAPARSPFFTQGAVEPLTEIPAKQAPVVRSAATETGEVRTVAEPGRLREIVLAVTDRLPAHADELRELDAALGDGDLGITVSSGARAVREAVSTLPQDAHPSEVLKSAGVAFASANPSTYAALVGGGLVAAATSVADAERFTADELATALAAFQQRIMERGGAQVGDKTVVDVIAPVADLVSERRAEPAGDLASAAVQTADTAVADGAGKLSQRGRASWVGERSAGHNDPGSVAFLRLLEEIAKEF
ncbi:dihydroxyacetone kinase family protein [Georgenia sp. H159]|uniref:dihydroxyacetone kinase family protein n=1 Tax=Georgenia sp. H159 TaxID=3076115 RepID=UPI002D769E2B|nr:dihydroxyacetone kinase family protein [Georgenia sp. H159]